VFFCATSATPVRVGDTFCVPIRSVRDLRLEVYIDAGVTVNAHVTAILLMHVSQYSYVKYVVSIVR